MPATVGAQSGVSKTREAMPLQVTTLVATQELGSEAIGLVFAAFVLLLAFGSALAMGLPIITALFGLGIGATLRPSSKPWCR